MPIKITNKKQLSLQHHQQYLIVKIHKKNNRQLPT